MHGLLVSRGNKPRTGRVITCPSCGEESYKRPSEIKVGRVSYCSRVCKDADTKQTLHLICEQCKSPYKTPSSQVKWRGTSRYCSKSCMIRALKERASTPKARSQKRKMRSGTMRAIDNLFSKMIRERDGSCQRCGTTQTLQCSHVIPRTYLSVRWDMENAITLCYRCHIYWWHKYPHEASAWFDNKYPGRHQALLDIVNQHLKTKPAEEFERLKALKGTLQ